MTNEHHHSRRHVGIQRRGAHLSSTAAGGELIQDGVELQRNLVDVVGGDRLGDGAARDGSLDLVDQAKEGLDGLDHLA